MASFQFLPLLCYSRLFVCYLPPNYAWKVSLLPDMEHFHHRLMAKGLSHGKAVLAMWAMAFCCSLLLHQHLERRSVFDICIFWFR